MAVKQPVANDEVSHENSRSEQDNRASKHDRSSRACLVCRQRKVKCDALECYPDKCTNCVQFNIKNCFLPAPKKRKSKKIEELLKTNLSLQNSPNSSDLSGDATFLNISTDGPYPSFVGEDIQRKHPDLAEIQLDPARVLKYIPGSVERNADFTDWIRPFMGTVLKSFLSEHSNNPTGYTKINATEYSHLVQSGCFLLPAPDVCWKWINAFFTTRLCQYPILIESTFREEYKDLTNPPSLLLLHSIIYCGAKYYDDPSWSTAERLAHIEKTEILYTRALTFYDKKIEMDLLCQLQSLLMMANYKTANDQCLRADPFFIRVSLDLCYALGIQKNPDLLPNVSELNKKLYKRIWWSLFITDTVYSFVFCKPWSINESVISAVPMITKEDLREDPNDPSDDQTYETLYFINRVKLTICIRKICDNMNQMNRQPPKAGVPRSNCMGECEQMMREWIEQLPTSLLFRINSPANNAFNASLSLEYYSILLLLYRMYFLNSLKPQNKDQSFSSWGIVFKAAHMVALIAKYALENNCISFCQMLLPFAMNIAGLMMIYHLYNKDKKVHNIAKQDIEIFLEVLYGVSYKHFYARLTYFYLKTIYEDKSMQAKMLNAMLQENRLPVPKITATELSNDDDNTSYQSVHTRAEKNNSNEVNVGHGIDEEQQNCILGKTTSIIGAKAEQQSKGEISNDDELKASLTNVPVNSILYNNSHNLRMPEIMSFNTAQKLPNGKRRSLESRSTSMSSTSAFLNSHSQILPLPVMENQMSSSQSPLPFVTTPSNYSAQYGPSFIPPNIIPPRDPPFMNFRHTPIEVKPSPMLNLNLRPAQQHVTPAITTNIGLADNMRSGTPGLFQAPHDVANVNNVSSFAQPNLVDSPSRYTPEIPNVRHNPSDNSANVNYNHNIYPPPVTSLRNNMANNNNNQLMVPVPQNAGSESANGNTENIKQRAYYGDSHHVLSQKFDLVMPPDVLPGIDTSNWHPEFDTSLLPFSEVDQIPPTFDFDMDLPL